MFVMCVCKGTFRYRTQPKKKKKIIEKNGGKSISVQKCENISSYTVNFIVIHKILLVKPKQREYKFLNCISM